MWGVAKPLVSSPGRTENYPPPVTRYLRSNIGSRSRGRSRASPMFLKKKLNAAETQEPSSPKVTCMGQVRVINRAKKPKRKQRCWCFRMALFCNRITRKLKPVRRPRWASSERTKSSGKTENFAVESRSVIELEPARARPSVSASSSAPPRDALILTRSRSAPYRTSSLAQRFWESSVGSEEGVCSETEQPRNRESEDERGSEGKSESEAKPRKDEEEESGSGEAIREDIEGSVRSVKIEITPENSMSAFSPPKPLVLSRCKSVPARIGERLDMVEVDFWKPRRSEFLLE